MIRLVIFGSRDFDDYELLDEWVQSFIGVHGTPDEIVSGTARGADQLGELWARENGVPVKRFPAEWDKYGNSAGHRRNAVMAEYATHALGFWDGQSKGTKGMIALCANMPTWVVDFTPPSTG